MRQLIINADDLGLSVAVSRGIEIAHRQGVVTSTTLLANFPAFDEGGRVAQENPQLGVGVHLNLIRGRPVSDGGRVAPLLDGENFIRNFWRIGRICTTKEYLAAAEIEYRAQIEKVLQAGIHPDHLDFEKHHGIWSPLYRLGNKLAREYGLGLRVYREPLVFAWQNLPPANWRAWWLALHLHFYQKFAHRRLAQLPDYFLGQVHIGKITADFLHALFANFPENTTIELMTHPGLNDEAEEQMLAPLVGKSWITAARAAELAALTATDWRKIAAENKIKLTTFAELKRT